MDLKEIYLAKCNDLISEILEIAKEKKMTYQNIADITGMEQTNVSVFFNKKYKPNIITLLRVAEAVGVDLVLKNHKKTKPKI